jgi:thioesterase domain-containing protein
MQARDDRTLPPPAVRRAELAGLPAWAVPRQGTEARLAEFFSAALNLDTTGADDDFFALGGTSHQAAAIFARIRAELGHAMPLATLYRCPTVRQLATALDKRAAANTPAPAAPAAHAVGAADGLRAADADGVTLLQAGSSALPLFIAPGIGGDVVGLAHLARRLDPAQTVYGLRSIGLQEGETPLTDLPAIAARFIRGLRRVQARGPWQFFGVCWGGLVMLEIARQLRDAGDEVRLLALLDPPPPRSRTADAARAPSALGFVRRRLALYRTNLAAKPLRQWPAYLGGRLVNLADVIRRRDPFRGDPAEYLRWQVRQANLAAMRSYVAPGWPGATLVFTSDRADGASRAAREYWAGLLQAEGRELYVPGRDSGDALTPERAGALAELLAPRLA